jgi:two-component system LytT family sensor kinase
LSKNDYIALAGVIVCLMNVLFCEIKSNFEGNIESQMTRVLKGMNFRETKVQIIFWISYCVFEWINGGIYADDFKRSFFILCVHLPLLLLASYYHLYITFRKFLLNKDYVAFIISLFLGFLVFGLIRRYTSYHIIYPMYFPEALKTPFLYWPKIVHEIVQTHMVVSFFIVVDLVRNTFYQQRLNDTYKQEKLEAEYKLLQSQVQPHFLFNTLNNMVSVSLHNPDQMPNLLQRLGGLLSYQLHESHQELVPISKEIEYLQDYIVLEKIRYGQKLDVQTNFADWKNKPDLPIYPMLLLPFVENAFKHGAAQSEDDCWIQIQLTLKDDILIFKVENSIPDMVSNIPTTGLGLPNLRKRMDILFEDKYELTTMKEDGQFLAILKIHTGLCQ